MQGLEAWEGSWLSVSGARSHPHAHALPWVFPPSQVLPFCSEETLEILEKNLGSLPSITNMLNDGLSAQDITDK